MKKYLILLLFGSIMFIIGFQIGNQKEELTIPNDLQFKSISLNEINDTTVYNALVCYGVKYPKIVLSQSILETGHFKSKVCKDYNNLFGLYDSKNKDYYKFDHWTDSILGYINSVEYKFKGSSKEEYYAFLVNLPYAEDKSYTKKVKQVKRKYILW